MTGNPKKQESSDLSSNKRKVGTSFEDIAARHLETLGYRILERNVYTPFGEVDIVAERIVEQDCTSFRVTQHHRGRSQQSTQRSSRYQGGQPQNEQQGGQSRGVQRCYFEVKARRSLRYGSPKDALTSQKFRRMQQSMLYLEKGRAAREAGSGFPAVGSTAVLGFVGITSLPNMPVEYEVICPLPLR